jgi:hypothetical protein
MQNKAWILNVFIFLKTLVHLLNIDFLELFWLIWRRANLKGKEPVDIEYQVTYSNCM